MKKNVFKLPDTSDLGYSLNQDPSQDRRELELKLEGFNIGHGQISPLDSRANFSNLEASYL